MPIKLTIFRKGLILVAVPLLFQLALVAVVAEMQRQVVEADRLADLTQTVVAKAESLQGALVDLETGSRGFALTKNQVFTEPYEKALKVVPSELHALKSLVLDPAQQAMILAIEPKANSFVEWHAKRIRAVRDGGSETVAIALEGKRQMDALRNDFADFLRGQERLEAARTLIRDRGRQTLHGVLIAGGVAAFAITFMLGFVFNRGIAGRLAVLKHNAQCLAQGNELEAAVAGTDEISEVDRAFHEMARAIRLYADIVKSVPIGLTIWRLEHQDDDRSLRLVDANPAASALLGVDVHGMLGKTILESFPSVKPEQLKAYADVVRTGSAKEVGEIRYGDERVRDNYWSVKAFPLPDCRVGLAFENISARQQAQDAIRRLNVELEKRVQERTSRLQTANEALEKEVAERKLAEVRLQQQLARMHLVDQITRSIGERQDLESIYRVVLSQLEENLPVDFNAICSFDPHTDSLQVAAVGPKSQPLSTRLSLGENAVFPVDAIGIGACARGETVYEPDITQVAAPFAQKLAQAGLDSLVATPLGTRDKIIGVLLTARRAAHGYSSSDCEFLKQLSGHVFLASQQAELFQDLKTAYDELRVSQKTILQQERLRALGQMASGIAHDINNAISPIAIYTESLLDNEPNLSPRAHNYLTIIQQAIEDVAHTVSRMRDFCRQQEKQIALEPVNLNTMVQQVQHLTRAKWRDLAQERGITIDMQTELAENLPAIMGVESEIRDALTNLIFNAVDAMPQGGTLKLLTFTGDREGAHAQSNSDPATHVILEVSDTGVGMDEGTRQRCLEPFFTTKGERGTGLGLAMVYGTMQRHSGDIKIQSASGEGTSVRLLFLMPQERLTEPAGVELLDQKAHPLRLLVVDDDGLLRKSLQDALQGDGHQVTTADGGQAGIDAFLAAHECRKPFELVITDLGMPYVDGRAVALAVKEKSPATAVILLTGWGQRMKAEGSKPAHVDHLLSKPPKLKELRSTLAAIAQERKTSNGKV